MNFPEKLRSDRKAAKLNQQELADRIGCHINTISDWELGKTEPGDMQLVAAAERALNQQPGTYLIELTYPAVAQVRHRPAQNVLVASGCAGSTASA